MFTLDNTKRLFRVTETRNFKHTVIVYIVAKDTEQIEQYYLSLAAVVLNSIESIGTANVIGEI